MREDVLRLYFAGDIPVRTLAEDLRDAVTHLDHIRSTIAIEDMQQDLVVRRNHILMLCDAFFASTLDAEALNTIAFALLASDRFELDGDDEPLLEVVHDWSAPEINFPLNEGTVSMHRRWLTGDESPPNRPSAAPSSAAGGVVSIRTKIDSTRPLLPIRIGTE
jgi:hypothetical protein